MMLRGGIRRFSFVANQLHFPEFHRLPAPASVLPATSEDVDLCLSSEEPGASCSFDLEQEEPDMMESSPPDPHSSEKKLSKREQYLLADETATIKSEGTAPGKKIQRAMLSYLQQRSGMKSSLSNTSVTMFNFHGTGFAEHLIKKNVGKVVIVESAYSYAKTAKDFAKDQRKQFRHVEAFHSELSTMLGIGRKKLVRFPSYLLGEKTERNPLILTPSETEDESGSKYSSSPVLISSLPFHTYQQQVLSALQANLLLHHNQADNDTLFQYGAVEMLTVLDLRAIAHLLCAVDENLSFFSHSMRRQSELFHKLFEIRRICDEGVDRRSFSPPIPNTEKRAITHEKKLVELGWNPSLLYAVALKPRTQISLAGKYISYGEFNLPSNILMSYAFWMKTIGREQHAKKVSPVISSLAPESAKDALQEVDGDMKIGDLSGESFERLFLKVLQEIEHSPAFSKYATSMTVKRHVD